MTSVCICCGTAPLQSTYASLLRCPACGHICADISLSDQEMYKLYSDSYFHGDEYGDYLRDKAVVQRNFHARIQEMKRHLPSTRDLSLFEIGCAYGFFLEVATPHFKEARGIDLSESITSWARNHLGVSATAGDFLEVEPASLAIDVICMWDTIEHLRDPWTFVAHAARILRPNGYIFLTTGDVSSLNARWRREKWRLIHPPSHLHYFSRESIKAILVRAGFEVVECRHVGFYRSIGNTVANLARTRHRDGWLSRLADIEFYYYLNLFDIMMVVARKRPAGSILS